jgi:hypothetical protein
MLAVPLLLVAPGVAGAAVTPGDYGGGALRPDKPGRLTRGEGWTWARVGTDGRARIGGAFHATCGPARFDAEVTLAPDGSFRFTRERRFTTVGLRIRAVVTVRGRFDGTGASGTLVGHLRSRGADGRVRRCSTRGPWQLRMPAVAATPAPAQPGAVYRGLTSQQGDVPRPYLLGVTRRGRVETTVFEYKMVCGKLAYATNDVSPGARIRPDGTFRVRERFTLGSRRIAERVRVRIDGGFRAGGVAGTVRVRSVVRNRRTGRLIDRCDSGSLTFAAVL